MGTTSPILCSLHLSYRGSEVDLVHASRNVVRRFIFLLVDSQLILFSDGFTLELLTTDLHHFTHSLSLPDRPTYSNVVSFWSNLQSSISVNNFWKSYLSNSSPLSWPSTAPLLGAPLSTSTIATKHWNGDLTAASRRIGVTPAVMSRIAIQIALGHHSKKKDIAVGIVRSGRDIDVNFCDTIIGPLVSVLPSRVILEPSTSLLDLLQQETSNDLLSRLNQTVTLSDLAKICQLTSRADIFDILVTYQSLAEREKEETLPYPIRQPPTEIYMPTSYTLSMEITPSAEDPDFLELGCFFDNRVIESEEVNQLLKTIARVLDYIVVAPCTTIDKMELGSVSPIILGIPVPIPQQKKLVDGTKMGGLIERLSKVWGAVLRLDGDSIGPDESFTALGGDSVRKPSLQNL